LGEAQKLALPRGRAKGVGGWWWWWKKKKRRRQNLISCELLFFIGHPLSSTYLPWDQAPLLFLFFHLRLIIIIIPPLAKPNIGGIIVDQSGFIFSGSSRWP
jgi:hypothetical protein